ncbi:Signal transduction response regulator [Macleaya cordata]|uniref:Signal transduction response regulator n=1 Tax=Macleaya cordata TaxID=56857 RepID=A0A200PVK0_MACCD|nr:Signal transduction response regulator [Macleaya cordata]
MAPPPSNLRTTRVVANGSPNAGSSELVLRNRITALVVDDSALTRMIHRTYLTTYGVESYEVDNGLEAVQLCQSGMNFNLILMDNDMPFMDGPQATRALRLMGVQSIIIGVTAKTQEGEIRAFMEAGLDDFFKKPLNRAKLIPVLRTIDDCMTNN